MAGDLVIGMAGSGGDGIISAGESLIAAAVKEGYYAMMTKSFGSQIRGGESSCRVRLCTSPIYNAGGTLDVAVVLDWADFNRFGAELPVDNHTLVIYEAASGVDPSQLPVSGAVPSEAVAVAITDLAKPFGDKAKNMVVLGLLAGWLGICRESLLHGIGRKLGRKGPAVLATAQQAFAAGEAFAKANPLETQRTMAPAQPPAGGLLLADGNDVCAVAALFAGCRFFGGYPITPSSEIMQLLSRELWKYGGSFLQAEDEIAGIGAAVGASFAGKKAMTATSGPGMSLKTEIMGLASIAELPLVIVDVQRGGPATGIPTKSEQSDLFQACFSAHGDVLRPVLAPTCVADTFTTTVEAFNIAEQFQTPVILLSDQEIAQRKEAFAPIDTASIQLVDRLQPTAEQLQRYSRFTTTLDGISPISHPGMPGGNYLASGIEHNEAGAPTQSGLVHEHMLEKRFRKFDPLRNRGDLIEIDGNIDAPIGVIAWGSTAGVCREAVVLARAKGIAVKLLIPRLIYPVLESVYRRFFANTETGVVIEQSYQGQLYRLLRMYVDVPNNVRSLARPGANPILARDVVTYLEQIALPMMSDETIACC
jgi:2-oxoglutarate/2-oxoacid ferredoxin oxidoreductase subunit alpha